MTTVTSMSEQAKSLVTLMQFFTVDDEVGDEDATPNLAIAGPANDTQTQNHLTEMKVVSSKAPEDGWEEF